ncbi:PHP domain-containing protein [Ornithinimicrobium faecis]|uniref:PHP domain-containing protein n=1 Tax=Ornithinimicrobium faecis TaxID=2934158 RepID=A0ABY4YWK6_9MICO|nr:MULTISPECIES: PHP domain-containing protein [unclassified Ornithinimicrobium]USQ81036.1 PHP domain-containing protein [Ornithinimicrobium sp. HY1793]
MLIDLHTHSNRSDGTETPAEVVRAGAAAGLGALALTDHDTVEGWAEADLAGREAGVSVIPGVELSCQSRGISVHVLAYLVDPASEPLREEMRQSLDSRVGRLRKMADLLIADGYLDSYEQVLAQLKEGATPGRPHLADAMVAAGRFPDRNAAFADVLNGRSRYYVGHYAPDVLRAVEVIREAGGVAVIAHPLASERGLVVGDDVIAAMARAGLGGIEVNHRDHGPSQRAHAAELARRLDLLQTGASDYHGAGKDNRLGENTTAPEVLEELLERGTGSSALGAPLSR